MWALIGPSPGIAAPVKITSANELSFAMPGSDVTLDKTAEVVMVHAGDGVTVKDTNSSGALLVGKNDSAYVPTSKTLHITVDAGNGTGVIRANSANTNWALTANATATNNTVALTSVHGDLYLIPAAVLTITDVKAYDGMDNQATEITPSGSYVATGVSIFLESNANTNTYVIKNGGTQIPGSTAANGTNKATATLAMPATGAHYHICCAVTKNVNCINIPPGLCRGDVLFHREIMVFGAAVVHIGAVPAVLGNGRSRWPGSGWRACMVR